tara:strand:- start:125 stop:382 length:258 start_codon:yes stop_codon:yes gene_type:complete
MTDMISIAAVVGLCLWNYVMFRWCWMQAKAQQEAHREERGRLISDFQLALLARTPEEFAVAKEGEKAQSHYLSEEEEWRLEQGMN